MKSTKSKNMKTKILLLTMFLFGALSSQAQNKKKIAVLDLDAVNMIYDGSEMARLLRMEVTKLDVGMVVDRYEMIERFQEKPLNQRIASAQNVQRKLEIS